MPPNDMEDGENKMFAQRHRARKLEASDARGSVTAITVCFLLAEFCFALISVVFHKIPETYIYREEAKKRIRMFFCWLGL